jgi:hypothetical protein
MRVALGSKLLNSLNPGGRQTWSAQRVAPVPAQGGQATFLETSLLPPESARGVTENPSHIVLIGPPLFDQTHHGMSFSHPVGQRVMRQDDPGDDDYAVSILGSQKTPIVDDPQAFGVV